MMNSKVSFQVALAAALGAAASSCAAPGATQPSVNPASSQASALASERGDCELTDDPEVLKYVGDKKAKDRWCHGYGDNLGAGHCVIPKEPTTDKPYCQYIDRN